MQENRGCTGIKEGVRGKGEEEWEEKRKMKDRREQRAHRDRGRS